MHRRETPSGSTVRALVAPIVLGLLAASGNAQVVEQNLLPATEARGVVLREGFEPVRFYADGREDLLPAREMFRPMCGSDLSQVDDAQLAAMAELHRQLHAELLDKPVDQATTESAGIDIRFVLSSNVPPQAVQSFALAEAYLESLFSDPIEIRITVAFGNLGSGVIGGTSSTSLNTTYADTRAGLINGMDSDDTLQPFMPTGSTIPVRYNASSTAITNENRVFLNVANFNATVGTAGTNSASMTYNTNFSFDFDPRDGITGSQISLVDVIIHETGHAMGFTSGIDFRTNDIEAIDLVRFQRTDGANNYNPDTLAQFQTTPRTVDFNNPNDDHNFDFIVREWRASDGSPWQASHFREQSNNIGIMDPAFSGGQTFVNRQPFGYFSQADIDMFDFIGYDYPPCDAPFIFSSPSSVEACEGRVVQLSVGSLNAGSFQWNRNGQPISNGADFSGVNTDTLTINAVSAGTVGNYSVTLDVAGGGCPVTSDAATVSSVPPPPLFGQPQDATVCPGEPVSFTSGIDFGNAGADYQWYENGLPLSNGNGISGAQTFTLTIASAGPNLDGNRYSYELIDELTGCSSFSENATLTVNQPAFFNQQPSNTNVDEGQTAQFQVGLSASASIQWQKNGQDLVNGGNVSGATSTILFISNATEADEGTYRAVATANGCETVSTAATLTVNPAPSGCNPADLAAPFGQLTFADISAFLAAFSGQQPAADLAAPFGQYTFADISAFLAAFSGGCP